jgi:hypothetical protein
MQAPRDQRSQSSLPSSPPALQELHYRGELVLLQVEQPGSFMHVTLSGQTTWPVNNYQFFSLVLCDTQRDPQVESTDR